MSGRQEITGIVAVTVSSAIWGASFVLAKLALDELDVGHVLLYRMLFALLPFLPILLPRRAWPRRGDLWLFLLTGFLMVPVTFFLQFGGLARTSATSTALLIGTGAPLLAVAGVVFERERLGRRGWTAVAISCLGVALLVGAPGEGDDWRGNLMILMSMIIATVWVILSKRLVGRYPALIATGWILTFGTLTLVPMTLVRSGLPPTEMPATVWLSLLGLGFGCTALAYVLWNWGVARIGAARAGVYLNLEPIVGAVLGIAVLGDPIGVGIAAGGALIVLAAVIVSRGPTDREGSIARWWQRGRPSLEAQQAIDRYTGPPGECRGAVEPTCPASGRG